MVRSPSSLKQTAGLKKGPWTSDEDEILTNHIKIHGHPNWRALPRLAGLARCGKSCRLRWTNYLQPGIKRGNFTREEEEIIINSHQLLGNRYMSARLRASAPYFQQLQDDLRWSAIAARLPGRTDNEIKNVWHTHLKKKVLNKEDIQQQSSATTDQSSDSRDDDVIFVDESIFDQVWEDRSNLVQQHAHADHDDPSKNPSNVPTSNTDSHNIYAPSLLLQRSDSEASYNNYKEVPSPEEFPETNESFWSDVLSSDYDHHDNSGSSSVENYYPCYHHQQPVLDNNVGIMETDPQQAYISSFPDVDSGKLNVSDHSNTVQDCGDVDDFWFDVLFRAGEHPAFLDM